MTIPTSYGGAFELPESSPAWEIHKFGGASLANAELYKTCSQVLIAESKGGEEKAKNIPTAAVVSAASGVTDELIAVVKAAAGQSMDKSLELLDRCIAKVLGILKELNLPQPLYDSVSANIERDKQNITSVLSAVQLMRSIPTTALELITGLGEVWSAQTLCAHLQTLGVASDWLDCRDVLFIEGGGGTDGLGEKGGAIAFVSPVWSLTTLHTSRWWLGVCTRRGWPPAVKALGPAAAPFAPVIVITGFVASTEGGAPTTLKRSGSDYSATIFAKLMQAGKITLWKNVDGIYTADPRRVPDAFPIRSMLYEEAMELAYFGAQVLHPSAMAPCIERRIPVHVRNIFNPSHPGTVIQGSAYDIPPPSAGSLKPKALYSWADATGFRQARTAAGGSGGGGVGEVHTPTTLAREAAARAARARVDKDNLPVKGITSIDNVALVNLEGATLMGVPGVASRMFGALANKGISVLMITQASSEHSVCCAVSGNDAQWAGETVKEAFELELERHQVAKVQVVEGLSALAIIGQGMSSFVGAAGRMFSAMSAANVNIVAIAQGSSERNITVIVAREGLSRAMRAVHSAFTLSAIPVSVGIVGLGRVGMELVRQMNEQHSRLIEDDNLDLRVRVLVDKDRMLTAEEAMDLTRFEELWAAEAVPYDSENTDLADLVVASHYPHSIIVDCTASEDVADHYPAWLSKGVHIVTANNRCLAGSLDRFKATLEACKLRGSQFAYEVTVGGPAPILTSMQYLRETGDRVHTIKGLLSSTLDHIFSRISPRANEPKEKLKFSEVVADAIEKGYSDRRFLDDLMGVDASRKCVIIARELGLDIEMHQVKIETLIPAEDIAVLEKLGDDLKPTNLEIFDAQIAERCAAAAAEGCVLRCISVVDISGGTAAVEIRKIKENDSDPLYPLVSSTKGHSIAITIHTDRYMDEPLVFHGPGSGAKLCASGVFADMLRVAKRFSFF